MITNYPYFLVILLMIIGLIISFFGWKIHKGFIFLVGAILIGSVGLILFGIIGLILGFILGGFLAIFLEDLIVCFIGLIIGIVIGIYLFQHFILAFIFGLFFSVIFSIVYYFLITVVTAVLGASLTGIGFLQLTGNSLFSIIIFFSISVFGFLFQIGIAPKINLNLDNYQVKKKYLKQNKVNSNVTFNKKSFCKFCNHFIEYGLKYCSYCGRELKKVTCEYCNHENDDNVLYCSNCGKLMKNT